MVKLGAALKKGPVEKEPPRYCLVWNSETTEMAEPTKTSRLWGTMVSTVFDIHTGPASFPPPLEEKISCWEKVGKRNRLAWWVAALQSYFPFSFPRTPFMRKADSKLQTTVSFWKDHVHSNTTIKVSHKLHAGSPYFSLHPLLPWCIMDVRLHMVVFSHLTLAPDLKE